MNAVTRYVAANAELEAAKADLWAMTRTLRDFAHVLERHPAELCFVGLAPADDPLAGRHGGRSRQWAADTFPGPASLQAALARLQDAAETARSAWDAVPELQRVSLVAPRP